MIEIILAASSYPSINLVLAQHFGPIYTLTQLSETDYSGYQTQYSIFSCHLNSDLRSGIFCEILQTYIFTQPHMLVRAEWTTPCFLSSPYPAGHHKETRHSHWRVCTGHMFEKFYGMHKQGSLSLVQWNWAMVSTIVCSTICFVEEISINGIYGARHVIRQREESR